MDKVKTGEQEAKEEPTEPKEVNSQSSAEEVIKSFEKGKDTPADELTPGSEKETPESSEKDAKTLGEGEEELSEEDKKFKEAQPGFYDRFKGVNDKFRAGEITIKERDDQIVGLQTENRLLNERIAEKKEPEKEPEKKKHDLSTDEGWIAQINDIVQEGIKKALGTIPERLDKTEKTSAFNESKKMFDSQIPAAQEVCKKFGINYGEEDSIDEKDSATGIGKIVAYMNAHPELMPSLTAGTLTKDKILSLALFDEGIEPIKELGKEEEKNRQNALKGLAMEGEENASGIELPKSDWSNEKILEFKEKHPALTKQMYG